MVGGDSSQSIGSISGMKKHSPNTKLLWIDANKEANKQLNDDQSISPLAYLINSEKNICYTQFQCLNQKDIGYIGIPNVDLKIKDELIIGSHRCTEDNL